MLKFRMVWEYCVSFSKMCDYKEENLKYVPARLTFIIRGENLYFFHFEKRKELIPAERVEIEWKERRWSGEEMKKTSDMRWM